MQARYIPDRDRYERMNTQAIRQSYLVDDLFEQNKIVLHYLDLDRTVIGSATPTGEALQLPCPDELRAEFFTERREIGILNVGKDGSVRVDGKEFSMANRDALYIGRGSKEILFGSKNPSSPAKFYLVSYPAHAEYPATKSNFAELKGVQLGSPQESNQRTIYKHIHADGVRSCQLVMGFTELDEGCVWNTMPAHRHMRRSEVYLYFNVDDSAAVFHLMGPPEETRHIVVRDGQAVVSPGWSIHAGSGTRAYSFIWAMGGENQDYTDMDPVAVSEML